MQKYIKTYLHIQTYDFFFLLTAFSNFHLIAFDRESYNDTNLNKNLTEEKCAQECSNMKSSTKTCKNYTWELGKDKSPYCDLHIEKSSKLQRWKSKSFKIYSSSCQDPKEEFDSCFLDNYTLGNYLNHTNTIKKYQRYTTFACNQINKSSKSD